MNSRPWSVQATQFDLVNPLAQTPAENQQNWSTLQSLITQYNQLASLAGNLQRELELVIAAFRQNQQQGFTPENVFPFDGVSPQHDLGYISNYCLKNWPS